jgi:hypothetical protein
MTRAAVDGDYEEEIDNHMELLTEVRDVLTERGNITGDQFDDWVEAVGEGTVYAMFLERAVNEIETAVQAAS